MYRNTESVDDALNSRPHILDGKEIDPKRAVAREVCDMVKYVDVSVLVAKIAAVTESDSPAGIVIWHLCCFD